MQSQRSTQLRNLWTKGSKTTSKVNPFQSSQQEDHWASGVKAWSSAEEATSDLQRKRYEVEDTVTQLVKNVWKEMGFFDQSSTPLLHQTGSS